MITVYFETEGYAEKIAVFETESVYLACFPVLEKMALQNGFIRVTETVE